MKSEKEKMLAGELYYSSEELINERRRAKTLLKELNTVEYVVTERAKFIIKELIPHSGSDFYIEPPFHCDYGYNIQCGNNVYFNVNCVVLDVNKVQIGSNVFIAPGVHIYTATHPMDFLERRKVESGKPVSIGDDCWIGGGAIILPGVSIGNRCVIGSGSVVTKDIPDDCSAVGNPARVMKKIRDLAI